MDNRPTSNPDLAGPIRKALVGVGINPADPVTVTDSDVSVLAGQRFEKFLDLAKLGVLRSILGNCSEVDEQVGTNYQKLSQLAEQVRAEIADLEQLVRSPYGLGVAPAAASKGAGSVMPNDPLKPCSVVRPWYQWPYPQ